MEQWFWCLRHEQAEQGAGCRAEDRLGPYESKAAAENYADRVAERNERWDEQDRRWDEGE